MIDLRSDTVTKPTQAMLETMMKAEVGDDVFGEDPSINQLEEKAASMFGMEAGLFCPSGTMTNQIAINVHTRPGDEIICHEYSHIYNYEGGGVAFNSSCQVRPLGGERGFMDPEAVKAAINPDDVHAARTGLIEIENTSNKGGGSCYEIDRLKAIANISSNHEIPLHLDGARIWNALVNTGQSARQIGSLFDSISICLSKGLGCPSGSVLLGSDKFIHQARRVRKKLGGGMRQAGFLAAAGIYALDHHIERLAEDHANAQKLKAGLEKCAQIRSIDPVQTNIVIFYLNEGLNGAHFLEKLREKGILAVDMGQGKLRFVTHLEIVEKDIDTVTDTLSKL